MLPIYKYIESINKYNYTIIKLDVPYMPPDFPYSYPVGKDIDILTTKKEYNNLINHTKKFFIKITNFKTKIIEKKGNFRLRFEHKNKLHYQIDIGYIFYNLNYDEILLIIIRSIKLKNFYIPLLEDEKIIRNKEIEFNKKKIHHKKWINLHK